MPQEKPSEIGFPITVADAEARGYRWLNTSKCRGCQAKIDWFETPNRKRIPIDHAETGFVPHFKTCPQADQFRRKK